MGASFAQAGPAQGSASEAGPIPVSCGVGARASSERLWSDSRLLKAEAMRRASSGESDRILFSSLSKIALSPLLWCASA